MIALVRGTIRSKIPFTLVLEASGVGYELLVTQEAYNAAGALGELCELCTRLIVREDSMTLFGFASGSERAVFDQLVSVSGIGPKSAIAILSGVGEAALREAIRTSDVHRLIAIPGVGRKTAERLIVELRDKFLKEELYTAPGTDGSAVRTDALQALLALGYQRAAAEKAIRDVARDQPEAVKSAEALIKAALKAANAA